MATASATSTSQTLTGCVKWFNNGLNYGFITVLSDGEYRNTDVFVHQSNIRTARDCFRTLNTGECVQFELAKSDNEKHPFHAINVQGFNGVQLRCEVPRGRGFGRGRGRGRGNGSGNGRGRSYQNGNGRSGSGSGSGNGSGSNQQQSENSTVATQENVTTESTPQTSVVSTSESVVSGAESTVSAPLDNASTPASIAKGKGNGKGRGRKVSA
jgi:cold shock CspA family protein